MRATIVRQGKPWRRGRDELKPRGASQPGSALGRSALGSSRHQPLAVRRVSSGSAAAAAQPQDGRQNAGAGTDNAPDGAAHLGLAEATTPGVDWALDHVHPVLNGLDLHLHRPAVSGIPHIQAAQRIRADSPKRSEIRDPLAHNSRFSTAATRLPSTCGADIAPGSTVPSTRDPITTSAPSAIAARRSTDCRTSKAWSPSTNRTTSTGGSAAIAVWQAIP